VGIKCKIPKIRKTLIGNNLLSLPCLLVRRTNGSELNYSQNYVMILEEYLTIMQQKAMDRDVAK